MADKPENPLQRLKREIEGGPPKRELTKSNHMLYLDTERFKAFKKYCETKKVRPSVVVDRLIELYLDEADES